MSMWGGTPVRRVSPNRQDRLFITKKPGIKSTEALDRELRLAKAEISSLAFELKAKNDEIRNLKAALSAPTSAGQARQVATEVAGEFGLTFFDMISQCRNRVLVMARKKAMWRIHKECSHMSLPMIGKLFGDRDHTTALHCIKDYQKHVDAGTAW